MGDSVSIQLAVLDSSGQQVSVECVECAPFGNGAFRLLRSPAMVQGVARGDEVRLVDESAGAFEVMKRSGFLAIQVFYQAPSGGLLDSVRAMVSSLDGMVDEVTERETGKSRLGVVVISVHVDQGWNLIETRLNALVDHYKDAGANWYFGNVYDPVDGKTPLRWWER